MASDLVGPASDALAVLLSHRGGGGSGGHPHQVVELRGGELVPIQHYEPDPVTFRGNYYYNSTTNSLYLKVVTVNRPKIGVVRAYWKLVSQ